MTDRGQGERGHDIGDGVQQHGQRGREQLHHDPAQQRADLDVDAVAAISRRECACGSKGVGTSRGTKDWCAVVPAIAADPATKTSNATAETVS